MSNVNKQTLIFLGPQGSGKGTQAKLITELLQEKDSAHATIRYDSGAALREFVKSAGYTGHVVEESLARGEIQPDFLVTTIFGNTVASQIQTGEEHVVLDGYPRTLAQADLFNGAMQFYKRDKPTVIVLTLSDGEAVKRLTLRGRSDDTEDAIKQRLGWYRERTAPLIEYFKSHEMYRVVEINGDQTVEQVHSDVCRELGI